METPRFESQSFLPLEQKSPTQRPQQFTIPRRPLPPRLTVASHEYLNSGKLQDSNVSVNVPDHVSQENSQQAQRQHDFWSPKWLRRRTLLAFVALFATFDASLIALWRFNKAQNGFRPTLSSNNYTWTYGPAAVLVVVVGLWRQVDYHCKIIQPWQEMRRGAKNAAQSVLLDYISPLSITSFLRAAHHHHVPVAASIAGFAILKLIILFSTGLLVLTPTSISHTSPATITTKFDGSSFWDTISNHDHFIYPMRAEYPYTNVSASPVQTYLGLLNGMSDPRSTVDGKAVQSFEAATHPSLSSISLRAIAFVPNITCEVAKTTLWYPVEGRLAVKLDTATCSLGHEHQTELYLFETIFSGCLVEPCPPFQILYNMWRVNCSDVGDSLNITRLNSDTPYDFRYALAVANVSHPISDNPNNATTKERTAHGLSIVICKIDYSVGEATVTHDFGEDSYRVDNLTPGSYLNNLTGLILGEIIYTSLGATQNLLLPDVHNVFIGPEISLFYVLLRTLNGEQAMDRFLSTETLQQSATQVFGGIAVQFMQQFYLAADDANTTGDGIYSEERLHIGVVSLWAMVAGFALLIVLSLTIMFTTLSGAVPQNPGPIAVSATILVASSGLQKLLYGTGSYRTSQLVERLRGWTFQTNTGENFNIRVAYEGALTGRMLETKAEHSFWIPYAARYWMVALTFGSPLAAIAALEVLYRVSNANMGLVDVSDSRSVALYLFRYISAAAMLLIATNFNSLDFTVASFSPFSLLRSGATPASRSLYFHLLGEMPPVALFQSIRTLDPGSAFSNMAGIIGSVLTVVASGLWVIDHAVGSDAHITASVASNWDVAWPNSALNDSGAAATLDQIQHGSASFPSSIWNDLVFSDIANVQINGGRSSIIDSTSHNYTFDVPAVRPVLTCDVVEDDFINIYWFDDERNGLQLHARSQLPLGCQLGGRNGTNNYTELTVGPSPPWSQYGPIWSGRFYDIHLGMIENPFVRSEFGEYFNLEQLNHPAVCPSIGIMFSEFKENVTSHDDITVLLCSQMLQQVSVKVTYDGSDRHHTSINRDIAPIPDEGSAHYLTNGTEGVDTFPYRIQRHLSSHLTYFDARDHWWEMDSFFSNLVYGPDGTPPRDLAGRANRDRLLEAIKKLYAKYMVLALHLHLRQPVPLDGLAVAAGEQGRLTGTMQRKISRLQVNFASKLALQIMLGLMTLLGTGAFWLTDLRGTLPRNPCSIASTMGFLAGSDLCDSEKPMLPKGAEWIKREELEKVLEGWLFSLGWWNRWQGECVGGHDGHGHTGQALPQKKEKDVNRFGIDVGIPERLGLRETKWWALRRRLGKKRKDMK
jgi:Protein of unknown function (DUF3433)